ncbi:MULTISPECIES: DUF4350 domain-containing protein [Sphingomonas]|uniref:DUF4350 domain-containing protein n=1 Tax=Sphingomonas TaxID=13687 RepID=UPI000DEFDDD8|nr:MULTISPECIES: hypothetical protein [Sphingomonas]
MIKAIAAGSLLLGSTACQRAASPVAPPPKLFLLTGLPLAFGESFTLTAPPSPVMTALEGAYRVQLIDGPEGLPPRGLLLAAQPRALTAERLVALDAWVRGGGRLLLLADPRLTWPSALRLGDRQRPPTSFADTGLLAHWGLRSEAPLPGATATLRFVVAGQTLASDSPGRLTRSAGSCQLAVDERSADCRLGQGRALVVADADFLRLAGGPEGVVAMLGALNR